MTSYHSNKRGSRWYTPRSVAKALPLSEASSAGVRPRPLPPRVAQTLL